MSIQAMVWALRVRQYTNITATAHTVLWALADCHNGKTEQCDPSISNLSKTLVIHKRNVQIAIRALESSGLITVTKGRGRSQRSSYCLHFERVNGQLSKAIKGDPGITLSGPKRRSRDRVKGDPGIAEKVIPGSHPLINLNQPEENHTRARARGFIKIPRADEMEELKKVARDLGMRAWEGKYGESAMEYRDRVFAHWRAMKDSADGQVA